MDVVTLWRGLPQLKHLWPREVERCSRSKVDKDEQRSAGLSFGQGGIEGRSSLRAFNGCGESFLVDFSWMGGGDNEFRQASFDKSYRFGSGLERRRVMFGLVSMGFFERGALGGIPCCPFFGLQLGRMASICAFSESKFDVPCHALCRKTHHISLQISIAHSPSCIYSEIGFDGHGPCNNIPVP